jgi:TonB family protein
MKLRNWKNYWTKRLNEETNMLAGLRNIIGEVSCRFFSFMAREIIFSVILFILILTLTIFLRKKTPLWHMGLWTFVLIRLVLPPDFSNPLVKYNVLNNVQFVKETNGILSEFNTQRSHNSSFYTQSISSTQNENTLNIPSAPLWKITLFGIWLLGFLITFSIHIKRYLYYRKVIWNSALLENDHPNATVAHWRKVFKIKRSIRIVYSQQCLSPFTVGVLKPVIYLPQRLLEINDKELLNSIISHEVTHIKHFDDLWIKFQNLIQSLYFFYPVVWYVNSRIHLARECLRDTHVISQGEISPKMFGNGILSLLKMNLIGSDEILYLPGFGSEMKKVTYRLRNLKTNRILMYQRMLIYLFLVSFGIFVVPIFGSLHSEGALADNYEKGIRLGNIHSLDVPSEEWSMPVEDEHNLASNSKEPAIHKSDSPDKSQTSPEKYEKEASESYKSINTKITLFEHQLPAPLKIPTEVAKGEFRDSDFEKENDITSPIRLDGQYTPPRLTKRVKPIYPLKARQDHVEGVVILEAITDVYGRVTEVNVLRSIPKLDQAALEAVKQWIYEPMIINGRLRSVIFKVTVTFKLERSP